MLNAASPTTATRERLTDVMSVDLVQQSPQRTESVTMIRPQDLAAGAFSQSADNLAHAELAAETISEVLEPYDE